MLWMLCSISLAAPMFLDIVLRQAELDLSADLVLVEDWERGTAPPEALSRLLARYDETGDPHALNRLLAAEAPLPAHDTFDYLRGVASWEAGDPAAALTHLGAVAPAASTYPQAMFIAGTIHYDAKRYRSAVRSFRDAFKAPQVSQEISAQALLAIGRTYLQIERYDQANSYFSQIPPESLVWPQAQLAQAWSHFYLDDASVALGHLLTLRSPQLRAVSLFPEADLLEAIIYLSFCQYDSVNVLTARADRELGALSEGLSAIIEAPPAEALLRLGDLPDGAQARLLQDRGLAHDVRRAVGYRAELQRSDMPEPVRQRVAAAAAEAQRSAGQRLREAAHKLRAEARDQMTQAEITRFEAVDLRTGCTLGALRRQSSSDGTLDFICVLPRASVTWPYDDEFWSDELGYYQVEVQDRCY